MGHYSSLGDWSNFNETYKKFGSDLSVWKDNVVPQYSFGDALTSKVIIRMWDGDRYDVRELTAYSATVMVAYRAEKLLGNAKSLFRCDDGVLCTTKRK
jgi:hypothetical protein